MTHFRTFSLRPTTIIGLFFVGLAVCVMALSYNSTERILRSMALVEYYSYFALSDTQGDTLYFREIGQDSSFVSLALNEQEAETQFVGQGIFYSPWPFGLGNQGHIMTTLPPQLSHQTADSLPLPISVLLQQQIAKSQTLLSEQEKLKESWQYYLQTHDADDEGYDRMQILAQNFQRKYARDSLIQVKLLRIQESQTLKRQQTSVGVSRFTRILVYPNIEEDRLSSIAFEANFVKEDSHSQWCELQIVGGKRPKEAKAIHAPAFPWINFAWSAKLDAFIFKNVGLHWYTIPVATMAHREKLKPTQVKDRLSKNAKQNLWVTNFPALANSNGSLATNIFGAPIGLWSGDEIIFF